MQSEDSSCKPAGNSMSAIGNERRPGTAEPVMDEKYEVDGGSLSSLSRPNSLPWSRTASSSSSGSNTNSALSQEEIDGTSPPTTYPEQKRVDRVTRPEKAGKLLEAFAKHDPNYIGMEVFSDVTGDGSSDRTRSPITPPPTSRSLGEDEKPVLRGMTPTPEESPVDLFFGEGSKWSAFSLPEKDGTVTSKFNSLRRAGSSQLMIKSEAQSWSMRINNHGLYLTRNGTKYNLVAGVKVVEEQFEFSDGAVNEWGPLIHKTHFMDVDQEPSAPVYIPKDDKNEASIRMFSVNLKKSPVAAAAPTPKTPKSLEYSYLLFSNAAYLVLKDYPVSSKGSPETAQVCGMSEGELIDHLENSQDPFKTAFTPLINARVKLGVPSKVALFFNTTLYRYYIYVEGNKLTVRPFPMPVNEEHWEYHTQFVFSEDYHNPGHDSPDAADLAAAIKATVLSGNPSDSHDEGLLTGTEPTSTTSEEIPEWPAEIVAQETNGDPQAEAQTNGAGCQA